MRIEINEPDSRFLIEHLPNSPASTELARHESGEADSDRARRFAIDLSKSELEQQLDALSELFCQIGLLENDEPNSTGVWIEHLIDEFNRPLQE